VSPSESFQKYPVNIDKIFFDTWDIICADVEEYFTRWSWMNNILG
jgi:hypothetical protein